jgi:hypothetical protein
MAAEDSLAMTIRWLDDSKRVIVIELTGDVTGNLLVESVRRANRMMDTVDHPVVVIHNFLRSGTVLDAVTPHLPEIARIHHPHNVMPIMISAGGRTRAVAAVHSRMFTPVLVFDTMEEALAHIRSVRDQEAIDP